MQSLVKKLKKWKLRSTAIYAATSIINIFMTKTRVCAHCFSAFFLINEIASNEYVRFHKETALNAIAPNSKMTNCARPSARSLSDETTRTMKAESLQRLPRIDVRPRECKCKIEVDPFFSRLSRCTVSARLFSRLHMLRHQSPRFRSSLFALPFSRRDRLNIASCTDR